MARRLRGALTEGLGVNDLRSAKAMLDLAAAVWNCVGTKHGEMRDLASADLDLLAREATGELCAHLGCTDDDEEAGIIEAMEQRKIERFLDDPRTILGLEVSPTRRGVHVSAASSLPSHLAVVR